MEVGIEASHLDKVVEEEDIFLGDKDGNEFYGINSDGDIEDDINNVCPSGLFSYIPTVSPQRFEDRYIYGYREAWAHIRSLENKIFSCGSGMEEIRL